MKVKPIGSNQTELHLDDGVMVLFSYETPVAAYLPKEGYVKTGTKYSTTTTRHINKWTGKVGSTVDQTFLNDLVEVK